MSAKKDESKDKEAYDIPILSTFRLKHKKKARNILNHVDDLYRYVASDRFTIFDSEKSANDTLAIRFELVSKLLSDYVKDHKHKAMRMVHDNSWMMFRDMVQRVSSSNFVIFSDRFNTITGHDVKLKVESSAIQVKYAENETSIPCRYSCTCMLVFEFELDDNEQQRTVSIKQKDPETLFPLNGKTVIPGTIPNFCSASLQKKVSMDIQCLVVYMH